MAAASAPSVTDDKGEESKDKAATDTGAIISSDTTAAASAVVEGTDAELNEEALVKQVNIFGDVKGDESIHFFKIIERNSDSSPLNGCRPLL